MQRFFTIIAVLSLPWEVTRGDDYHVAFWNVENLFDPSDDPSVEGDEEFTPTAPKQWTNDRFVAKLQRLARVICDMNNGRGPDVLGLAEVENRFVIERLVEQLGPLGRNYDIVHRDSPSGRGIDCALIFDRNRLTRESSDYIFVDAGNTRDIVEVKLAAGGHDLFVFVNHWPSRGNPETHRTRAAGVLRGRVDQILANDATADIVIIGDLNDYPTDESVRNTLGAGREAPSAQLLNTMWPIEEDPDRGTYWYSGAWEVIDHIIVSRGMLDSSGFRWRDGSTTAVASDYQLFTDSQGRRRPDRTYGGDRYYGGYSDHLPVACLISLTENDDDLTEAFSRLESDVARIVADLEELRRRVRDRDESPEVESRLNTLRTQPRASFGDAPSSDRSPLPSNLLGLVSWNIQIGGTSPDHASPRPPQVEMALREILDGSYQILAAQEISSSDHSDRLLELLPGATEDWRASFTDTTSRMDNGFWFASSASIENDMAFLHPGTQNDSGRIVVDDELANHPPRVGHFTVGDFDFTLISLHLTFHGGNTSESAREFRHVLDFLDTYFDTTGHDPDVIVAGDFNIPSRLSGQTGSGGVTLDALLEDDFRFQIGDRRFGIAIHEPTSRSTSGADIGQPVNNYDHFLLSADCMEEFITARRINASVLLEHSGEIQPDGSRRLTSDHFPIVGFFRTQGEGVQRDVP